jgi:predicted transposase YbfD/YdcC/histone H3/H4
MGVETMREICEKYFGAIEDTRCQCDVDHKLNDVLIIIMCAILCGLDKPEEIVTYGKEKRIFLEKHFGITKTPSESTLSRIMNMINGDTVAESVIKIMREQIGQTGEIIAADGKTICSTAKKSSVQEKLHILTAYMTENGVTLGQLAVNEKTNEIPVMRELLEMIEIKGKIITADAMHCQKETVEKIIEMEGDYVIGLKGNQGILLDEVKGYIEDCIADETIEVESARTTEKNKDRFEQRTCNKAPDLNWLESKDEWAGLKTAFSIHRRITTKKGVSEETSYYISSIDLPASRLLEIVREHWKIESMHWMLDVVFSEDDCRILNTNGQKMLNIFRKLSIAFHKNFISGMKQKTKPSIKNNMLKSLMSNSRLLEVIGLPM